MPNQIERYRYGRRAQMVSTTARSIRAAVQAYRHYKKYNQSRRTSNSTAMASYRPSGAQDHGTDTTFSSFRRGSKKRRGKSGIPRSFHKVFAVQRINSITDTTVVGVRNRQSVQMLNQFSVSPTQSSPYIYLGGSTNQQRDMLQADLMLRYLDPAYSGPVVVDQDLTLQRKWMSLGVRVLHRIKNQHNFPVKVTLYDIMARRDLSDEGQTTPDQLGDESPPELWERGIEAKNVGVGSLIDQAFPGSTPYQSELFCRFWQVGKKTTFMLHPGSEHHHRVSVTPAYMFNVADFRVTAAKRGLTMGVMCVLEGGIGTDATLNSEAQLSLGKLAVITQYTHRFQCYERSRPTIQQFLGLTEGEQQIQAILEDTDIVAAAANA